MTFRIEYDEMRVLLSCARTPEKLYSAFGIVPSGPTAGEVHGNWAAQPQFVAVIRPPLLFLLTVVLLFSLGLYLLQLSPADVESVFPLLASKTWFAALSRVPKALGTLFVFTATWRYVRKFPLK